MVKYIYIRVCKIQLQILGFAPCQVKRHPVVNIQLFKVERFRHNKMVQSTYKSLQGKSLSFVIFWESFENCQLKTLVRNLSNQDFWANLAYFFPNFGEKL